MKKQPNLTEKRIRISLAEFKQRLKAGDPESVKLWKRFLEEIKPDLAAIADCYQGWENDSLKSILIGRLESLSNSDDPFWRTIGRDIDIVSFIEMIKDIEPQSRQFKSLPAETGKKKGRYRLTEEDIKYRRSIVEAAEELKKKDSQKTWKQIAYDLDKSERTLRAWRHNNY